MQLNWKVLAAIGSPQGLIVTLTALLHPEEPADQPLPAPEAAKMVIRPLFEPLAAWGLPERPQMDAITYDLNRVCRALDHAYEARARENRHRG